MYNYIGYGIGVVVGSILIAEGPTNAPRRPNETRERVYHHWRIAW